MARMYSTAAKIRELSFFTRLSKDFRSDLYWWYTFIGSWNGLSIFRNINSDISANFCIQTDASGSWGCGACWGHHWFQWPWPKEWEPVGIMGKELVPIVMSCAVWGPQFAGRTTLFQCDNLGLVVAITKGSSKDKIIMHLLRSLWILLKHSIYTLSQNTSPVQITAELICCPEIVSLSFSTLIHRQHHCQLHYHYLSYASCLHRGQTGHQVPSDNASQILSQWYLPSHQKHLLICPAELLKVLLYNPMHPHSNTRIHTSVVCHTSCHFRIITY